MLPRLLLPLCSIGLALAAPSNDLRRSSTDLEGHRLIPRATNDSSAANAVCTGNTAEDRSVWCDFDTSTNYYDDGPDTGVVREYWFDIVNTTLSPDGIPRTMLTVNGSFPGPTIEANW